MPAPSAAAALAEGVMHAMIISKLRGAVALVVLASLGMGWMVHAMHVTPAGRPIAAVVGAREGQGGTEKKAPQPAVDARGDPLPAGAVARMGTLRLRHGNLVTAVVYSPDGKFVAAGGHDRTVRLWDPKTGKELACLRGHTDSLQSLALSRDGSTLASAGNDGVIFLWDVKNGQASTTPRKLTGHTGYVLAVLFGADGKSLISGGKDGSIRVWDSKAGTELRSFGQGKGVVRSLALASDGKTLASANWVGDFGKTKASVQLWQLPEGKHVRELVGGQKPIYRMAFSPGGDLLATGGDDGPKVWEVASGSQLVKLRGADTSSYTPCVIFSPNGRSLIAGGAGFLREWRLPTGSPGRSFDVGKVYTYAAAWSPDGKTLATGCTATVNLWDAATAKPRLAFGGHDGEVSALTFTADSKELLTAGYGRTIYRWNARDGREVGHFVGPQDWNNTLVLSPDGKTIATLGKDLAVVLLDAQTGRPRVTFKRHLPARVSGMTQMYVVFAPDSKTVFSATLGIDHHIRRWEAETGQELLAIPFAPERCQGLALSPDGKTLFSAMMSGLVRVWDAQTGRELPLHIGQPGPAVSSPRLSPDGRHLAVMHGDRVGVHDAATGKELWRCPRPGGYAPKVVFAPDGRTLAIAGSEGNRVQFWETATGQMRQELAEHTGHLRAIAFSPDGRLFATGSTDTTALVWDFRALPLAQELAGQLPPERLEELAADLSSKDAKTAFRAVCALARAPKQTVGILGRELGVGKVDAKKLAALIEKLGAEEREVREKAMKELAALGRAAEAALRKVQANHADVDVRLRAGVVLRKLDKGADRRLHDLRALEVLEAAGTAEARRVVAELARGPAEAELTREAKAVLGRMEKRNR
jgi:WD40 repeat protein